MRIQNNLGFVYISTPKACTHTIYKILEEHFAEGLQKGGFHSRRIPRRARNYFRWTCVRNPYSRAVSIWWSACRCHSPDRYGCISGCGSQKDFKLFADWLGASKPGQHRKEPVLMSQCEWLSSVEPIHAIHVEHLADELHELEFWKPGITIPKLNTTTEKIKAQSEEEGEKISRPSWQELCQDQNVQQAIQVWAGHDFDRFGYSKDI